MASNTVLASNFDASKISFSQIKVLDSGGKQAQVNQNEGLFVMQTPSCVLPYGMSAFDKAGPVKQSVELSLRGYEDQPKMKQFQSALERLDEFMIQQGVKNSRQWFKSDLSRDVVKAFYTPMVRIPLDKEGNRKPQPPTIKLSLRTKRDSSDFDVTVQDENKQPYKGIPLEELLVKGASATCLIQCTGVWFAGSKYGLSWKAVLIRMDNLPQNARGFTFVDEGEEFSAPSRSAAPTRSAPAAPAAIEDDEEEEEEDEAFQAPPARPSVVSAVTPAKAAPAARAPAPVAPAPAADEDEDGEDADLIPVPKRTTTTTTAVKKRIVKKA